MSTRRLVTVSSSAPTPTSYSDSVFSPARNTISVVTAPERASTIVSSDTRKHVSTPAMSVISLSV